MTGPSPGAKSILEAQMPNETASVQTETKETKIPCEVYSRIVGYLRPVQNWNKGKRQEFAARRTYRVKAKDTE
jgi:anaerobic ribonucleoside-triphosphate reductase